MNRQFRATLRFATIAAASLAATAPALSAGPAAAASAASPAASAPSAADTAFVETATRDANTDLVLGGLAQTKATTPALKAFGERIAQEHRRIVDELTVVALARGVSPPPHLDPAHQKAVDSLANARGELFDSAFALQMNEDLARTLALYRRQAARGADAPLAAFARKTVPVLEAQLKAARGLGRPAAVQKRAASAAR